MTVRFKAACRIYFTYVTRIMCSMTLEVCYFPVVSKRNFENSKITIKLSPSQRLIKDLVGTVCVKKQRLCQSQALNIITLIKT